MNRPGYNMNGCNCGGTCGTCSGPMNNYPGNAMLHNATSGINPYGSISVPGETRMNGEFDWNQLLGNLSSGIGSGEPIATMGLKFDTQQLIVMGAGLLGILIINEKLIK